MRQGLSGTLPEAHSPARLDNEHILNNATSPLLQDLNNHPHPLKKFPRTGPGSLQSMATDSYRSGLEAALDSLKVGLTFLVTPAPWGQEERIPIPFCSAMCSHFDSGVASHGSSMAPELYWEIGTSVPIGQG